jgi:hypothetical protein
MIGRIRWKNLLNGKEGCGNWIKEDLLSRLDIRSLNVRNKISYWIEFK